MNLADDSHEMSIYFLWKIEKKKKKKKNVVSYKLCLAFH